MKSIKIMLRTFYFLLCIDFLKVFALPSSIKIGKRSPGKSIKKLMTWFLCVQTNLGAIFREDQKDSIVDLAFKFAIHKINKDQNLLPKTKLIYDIQYVQKADDSFHANKQGDLYFYCFWNWCFRLAKCFKVICC